MDWLTPCYCLSLFALEFVFLVCEDGLDSNEQWETCFGGLEKQDDGKLSS